MHRPRRFRDPFEECPSKRRSKESFSTHMGINSADRESIEDQDLLGQARNRSGSGLNFSETVSMGQLETPTSTANKSPPVVHKQSFNFYSFDFEMNDHPDDSADFLNDLFPPGQGTQTVISGDFTADKVLQFSQDPGNQPTQIQDDCLYRLSDLSSKLLKDFSRTGSGNLSDLPLSSPYASARPSKDPHDTPKATHSKNTIGRLMENSQAFLDILQDLNRNRSSSADSICSYTESSDDSEFFAPITRYHSDPPDDMALASDNITRSSTADDRGVQKLPSPSVTVDMPTTLTILTCYTYLLQTYDTDFSRIYNALTSQAKNSPPSAPAILPGLYIGGFNLDNHNDLQMEVLIQLSWRMLERIEKILGISVISPPQDLQKSSTLRGGGILCMTSASTFLDALFKQKGLRFSKGVNGRSILMK